MKACIQILQFFCIYVFLHIIHVVLHFSDGMNYLVEDGVNSLWQGVLDDVPESSTHRHGTLRPPVPMPSPLTSPVSLEQLLASQNAIMQRLAEIGECQVGHSQHHQQPQNSSYLDILATHPPVFVETTDPLEANH
jgi:hypothetical protein